MIVCYLHCLIDICDVLALIGTVGGEQWLPVVSVSDRTANPRQLL